VADAFCITSCAMQANASIDRVSLGKGSQTKHRSSILSVVREGGYSDHHAGNQVERSEDPSRHLDNPEKDTRGDLVRPSSRGARIGVSRLIRPCKPGTFQRPRKVD
jgi:hypothetical protein